MQSNGTLGSLLQGVSQQPERVRPSGKVSEQINFDSDVVEGLTPRPPLIERASVSGVPADMAFIDVELEGETYILGYSAGVLRMWDTMGVEQTITATPDSLAYVGGELRPFVYEDRLLLANREVVVEKAAEPDSTNVLEDHGIVYCLGGLFSRQYKVSLNYADGVGFGGTYTTPDGTNAGDADKTAAPYIISELRSAILAHQNIRPGTEVFQRDNHLMIRTAGEGLTIRVDDGEDGTSLRGFTTTVAAVSDLSEMAPHGMAVRVRNSDEGNEDDYFLRFNSDTTSTVGQGFGGSGYWEEWFDTSEVSEYDRRTMPHVMVKTGPGQFAFGLFNWLQRKAGSEATNPFPSFVGHAIRDIGGFQSRLVLVAGPWCCMSETNSPGNFFKPSAITDSVSDPITLSSTKEGTVRLDWIVPFDRDLVLLSDPGSGQFIITGSTGLTPENAGMVETTSFEIEGGAKPVGTGRTIVFPFSNGRYAGVKEFFTNDEVATNGADTLTEALDKYIVGRIRKLKCNTNFNTLVIATDGTGFEDTLWVYKYLWQRTEKVQSSWYKWTVPGQIEHFFFRGSDIFITFRSGTDLVFGTMDLDASVTEGVGYRLCLDRQKVLTVDANGEVVPHVENPVYVQGAGCTYPGAYIFPVSTNPTVFDPSEAGPGAEVYCGVKYNRLVKPTAPFVRDGSGNVLAKRHIVIGAFQVDYEETGHLKTTVASRYRSVPQVINTDFFPIGADPDDPGAVGLRSGTLSVPCGERNTWTEFTIESDDVRPNTIIEVRWTGETYRGGR